VSTAWIDAKALAAVRREATERHPDETGGILLGWTGPSSAGDGRSDVVIAEVIGPGPGARHDRTTFRPDAAWQTAQVARLYEASGRRHTYLGDWHTHPNGSGRPSRRDRRTLATIARSPDARAPHPVILIVEHDPDGPFCAWRWTAPWRNVERLTVQLM
jgi:integrative and conjugative element protein (TIGR02256 family)